jgi:glycosyltransferase involved in cell wall biosynthesis
MRRIVHYYPDAMGHSGVTWALWGWARAQAAAGIEVCVLHASEPTSTAAAFVSKDDAAGVTTRCVAHRGRNRLAWPVALDTHLGGDDLLVLHEGWVIGNLVAAAAARRAGVPYIVMPHGVYERAWAAQLKPPRWLRNRLERRLLEGAAAVHVFFESEIADIAALAPAASFVAVPTGFDVPPERWTGGGGYLGWIGRIDPTHKGLDLLIGAIACLAPQDRPNIRIRGYDYADGVARLQRLIDAAGVREWVDVRGAITGDEKAQFMRDADGYLHPSRWECHSIALLEHLALGVPCLVSDRIHIAPMRRCSRRRAPAVWRGR